jgi:hypothetical protein
VAGEGVSAGAPVSAEAPAESPGMPACQPLQVTFEQACRLWQVDVSTCERLLDYLIREGFSLQDGQWFLCRAGSHAQAKLTDGRVRREQDGASRSAKKQT